MGDLTEPAVQGPEREALIQLEPGGVVESFPLPGGGRRWVVHTGDQGADPSPARLASLVQERTGVDLDPGSCPMLSALTVRRRTAPHALRAGAPHAEQEWRRAERRIRRRARLAGRIAGVNTALGRPVGPRLSALRAAAVGALLRTPLRRGLAWVYSMGWARPGRRIR